METSCQTVGRGTFSWQKTQTWGVAMAAVAALLSAATALATPNNGQGPTTPIGGGELGPIGPNLPPGFDPCNPPQLPPGLLSPSYAHGRIRETCGGVLRGVANKPIQIIFHTEYQPIPCNGGPLPPAVFTDTPLTTGETDANGEFDIEFDETQAGTDPNDPRVTTRVRIIVYDDSGTVPIWQTAYYTDGGTQVYDVFEDVDHCLTEGTRIRIVSPTGTGAFGAELFVDGHAYPDRANANGFITINPPLQAGSELVARALVFESKSDRHSHAQGSDQNWKYRAYITSIPLQYDSNGDNVHFTPAEVTDPNGAYELVLRRDAPYIGVHLVGSLEWDASPAELTGFEARMQAASRYMYNATDGQMLIERVDVYDDHHKWDQSDFQVYANASLRANVDWPHDGFWRADDLCCWRSSHMHMSRSNDHPVYDHEFGHYGLLLGDEYEDNGDKHCAAGVGGSIPEFAANGGKASCMMHNEWSYKKICSKHAANPHLKGTGQGDEDCWSEVQRHFTAEADGPNGAPRWRIKTPYDRGVIVGRLPGIPVSDWEADVETHDFNNTDLCQPVQFQWASNNGFANGASVFSRDSSGRTIIQGTTDATGVITPFQDNVTTVAGLHVGDTIGAAWYQYGGNGYTQFYKTKTFTTEDCMNAMVVLAVQPGQAPPAPQEQMVEADPLPFALSAEFEPGASLGEAVVRVRAASVLSEAPSVRLSIENEVGPRDIAMAFDNASGDWIGDVDGLPDQFAVIADVQAVDENGAKAAIMTQATFSGAVDDDDSELGTADGSVRLSIPMGTVAEPTQIAIGGSVAPLPDDFPGRILVGPIAIATNGTPFALSAKLSFPMRFDSEAAMLEQIDPAKLSVLSYDESTGTWNEIDSEFHAGPLAVETEIAQPGTFVLIERDDGASVGGATAGDSSSSSDSASNGDNGDAQDATPVPAANCGAGTFGVGMAMVSPLMLVLAGTKRRRRKSRRP